MKCVDCRNFRYGFCDPPMLMSRNKVKIYNPEFEMDCVLFERRETEVNREIKFDIEEMPRYEVSYIGIVKVTGSTEQIIIPKEIFVEAFEKYIGNAQSE